MKPQSLDAAYERRAMKDGLVTEPVFDENDFWKWCHENGYYDKDYILDHQAELEEMFFEEGVRMKPHKWAKEIKAWADGAEIEYFDDGLGKWRDCTSHAIWDEDDTYRIKPQSKEPQYLYVYSNQDGKNNVFFKADKQHYGFPYIGKIKLESEDE